MNTQELLELAQTLKSLGASVEVNPEELEAYYPQVDEESLYLPAKPASNFYYDAPGLRSLTRVNSSVFRRLLGIQQ